MPRSLLLTLALAGCSDFNLTPGGPGVDPAVCRQDEYPAATVDVAEDCRYINTGTFTPVLEHRYTTFVQHPASNAVLMVPAVAQVNDDNGDGVIDANDIPDIIVVTHQTSASHLGGTLRALSGAGGVVHWTGVRDATDPYTGVAVGDIDGDGLIEIITRATGDFPSSPDFLKIQAWEHDGTPKWEAGPFHTYDLGGTGPHPSIADLDSDGSPEVIVGRVALNADGSTKFIGELGAGQNTFGPTSFGADLEGDGTVELIAGNTVYNADGTIKWQAQVPDGPSAIADFDGDGQGEVVVTNTAGRVFLIDTDGSVIWQKGSNSTGGGPPTVADFDGDGEPEIGMAGYDLYTVFDTDGSILWQQHTSFDMSATTGSSVFDFEGDGVAEVVYADEETLWVLSGVDGTVRMEATDHASLTGIEYPIVADVDGDGQAEIVTVNNQSRTGSSGLGIKIFGDADESWVAAPKIWNQHAFHITNINPDGTIPAHPTPAWLVGHNSFRSGGLTTAPNGLLYDLRVTMEDVCLNHCGDGDFQVWGSVRNHGTADIDGVVLVLSVEDRDGVRTEVERMDVGSVASGEQTEGLLFEITGYEDLRKVDDVILSVEAPETDEVWECVDTNNRARWGFPVCN